MHRISLRILSGAGLRTGNLSASAIVATGADSQKCDVAAEAQLSNHRGNIQGETLSEEGIPPIKVEARGGTDITSLNKLMSLLATGIYTFKSPQSRKRKRLVG